MKKLVLVVCMLLIALPCYANIVSLGGGSAKTSGFDYTPVTKTDTNADDANTYTTETDTVVWTPDSGKSIVLMGMYFTSDTATTLRVENGSVLVAPLFECTASGLVVINASSPIWKGSADETLTYTVGTKGRHSILMYGYEE